MNKVMTVLSAATVAAVLVGSAAAQQTGTFTDGRDGQRYKTVKIGKQTWMAQNINYQTKGGSWCYNDSASYCKQYGRLYDWDIAKTVCPKGWKLPSREDWDYLASALGGTRKKDGNGYFYWDGAGKKLKARSGWNNNGNGTDEFGFSALPGGSRNSNGSVNYAGDYGYWWAATEDSDGYAYARGMGYDDDHVIMGKREKDYAFSVRCLEDSK